MSFHVTCPSCRKTVFIHESELGSTVLCSTCRSAFQVASNPLPLVHATPTDDHIPIAAPGAGTGTQGAIAFLIAGLIGCVFLVFLFSGQGKPKAEPAAEAEQPGEVYISSDPTDSYFRTLKSAVKNGSKRK